MSEFAAFENHAESAPSQASYLTPVKKRAADALPAKEKRIKLRHYDLAPVQCLNPMGVSSVEELDNKKYWDLICKGNQAARYFSELCSPEDERRLIGLSRTAEVLFEAINLTENNKKYMEKIMQPEVFKEVFEEAGLWFQNEMYDFVCARQLLYFPRIRRGRQSQGLGRVAQCGQRRRLQISGFFEDGGISQGLCDSRSGEDPRGGSGTPCLDAAQLQASRDLDFVWRWRRLLQRCNHDEDAQRVLGLRRRRWCSGCGEAGEHCFAIHRDTGHVAARGR